MNILSLILAVVQDACGLIFAPFLDDLTTQEDDSWGDEIVVKQIDRACPSTLSTRANKMGEEVGNLRKSHHQGSAPFVQQAATDQGARKFVKQRVAAERLVNSKIQAPPWFQNSQIFSEGAARIFGVMNHTVGNNDIGNPVREWKAKVVRDNTGAAIPTRRKVDRDAAAVDADAVEPAFDEKSEDSSRTAANIEDERV